eukprot:3138948-Pleurochrysis_carterae.AAC.1
MKNYEELYRIPDDDIAEVKISPAMMLIVQTRLPGHVPIRIVSIEDGRELVRLNHLLNRTRKVQFVELFNEKLLVKQVAARLIFDDFQLTRSAACSFAVTCLARHGGIACYRPRAVGCCKIQKLGLAMTAGKHGSVEAAERQRHAQIALHWERFC